MAKTTKSKTGRGWWWLLLIVIVAGLGYYLYSGLLTEPAKEMAVEGSDTVKKIPLPTKQNKVTDEEESIRSSPIKDQEETGIKKAPPEEDYCTRIEKNMAEYFRYLDAREYVRRLNPKADAYTRFKKILRRLSARPPFPAGEGTDSTMIIQNLYHFFRIIDRKDMSLIRAMLKNEQDTMEISLEMFYRWATLGHRWALWAGRSTGSDPGSSRRRFGSER